MMTDDLVKRLLNITVDSYEENETLCDAADRIEQLERLLEQRDAFIVKNDLWHDFVAALGEKKDGRFDF